MIRQFALAAFVAATLLGTSSAVVQERTRGRSEQDRETRGFSPFFQTSNATIQLLRIPEVQKELKLDAETQKKIDDLSTTDSTERARLVTEYLAKLAEINRKGESDVLALLAEHQRRRAEQIKLQEQGLRAFSTAQVADALGLSKEQRDEITKITRDGSFSPRGGAPFPNSPNSNEPVQDRLRRFAEEAATRTAANKEKILSLLTAEQKAKWSEMVGEEFKFPPRQPRSSPGRDNRTAQPKRDPAAGGR